MSIPNFEYGPCFTSSSNFYVLIFRVRFFHDLFLIKRTQWNANVKYYAPRPLLRLFQITRAGKHLNVHTRLLWSSSGMKWATDHISLAKKQKVISYSALLTFVSIYLYLPAQQKITVCRIIQVEEDSFLCSLLLLRKTFTQSENE